MSKIKVMLVVVMLILAVTLVACGATTNTSIVNDSLKADLGDYLANITENDILDIRYENGEYVVYGVKKEIDQQDWTITVPEGVDAIHTYAFRGSKVEVVILPQTLKRIGNGAFMGCERLHTIEIPEGIKEIGETTFQDCKALSTIVIPNSVDYIDYAAFYRCASLKNVKLPAGLDKIADRAFEGCTALTKLDCNINDGYLRYMANEDGNLVVFSVIRDQQRVVIPEGVVAIGPRAFDASYVQEVIIPDTVKEIGNEAFLRCNNLETVVFPNDIKKISDGLFHGCTRLRSFIVPETVETIGAAAFWQSGLSTIYIPYSVSYIDDSAFQELSISVYYAGPECWWENLVAKSHEYAFYKGQYQVAYLSEGTRATRNVEYKSNPVFDIREENGEVVLYGINELYMDELAYVVPEGVTAIHTYAFRACKNAEAIIIPDTVKRIGDGVFMGCENLTYVKLPAGIKEISSNMFHGCSSLQEFVVPNTVETIGDSAFWQSGLETIHIPYSVNYIDESAFLDLNLSIHYEGPECWWENLVARSNGYAFYGANYQVEYLCGCIIEDAGHPIFNIVGSTLYGVKEEHMEDEEFVIPAGITEIASYAFRNTGAYEIIIPSTVKKIGTGAFAECFNLEKINLPEGIERISENMFMYCQVLEEITIPSSVKTIDAAAFLWCESLERAVILGNVTAIEENAFAHCDAMVSINIPQSVSIIGQYAFQEAYNLTVLYEGPECWWENLVAKSSEHAFEDATYDVVYLSEYQYIDNSVKISASSISLESDFSINFHVDTTIFADCEDVCLIVEKPIYNENGEVISVLTETITEKTLKGDYYVFTYTGIRSTELATEVVAKICATKDGIRFMGKEKEYSVKQYAENMLRGERDYGIELDRLLVDMLNYGAAAQIYFNYNTDDLANAGLTDEELALASTNMNAVESFKNEVPNANATVDIKGCSLALENRVEMKFTVDIKDNSSENLYAKIVYFDRNGKKCETIIDGSEFTKRDDRYVVTFAGLAASEMRTVVALTIYDKNTDKAISNTREYSIESYASSALGKYSANEELSALVEAMMIYGDSAHAFFN